MNKSRNKKFKNRFNKSSKFKNTSKKKKSKDKIPEPVNKKAQFNRYKDKQRVEEELAKKRKLEEKFKEQYLSSESEEEDDQNSYQQLLSTFQSNTKRRKVEVQSDNESDPSDPDDDANVEDKVSENDDNDESLDGHIHDGASRNIEEPTDEELLDSEEDLSDDNLSEISVEDEKAVTETVVEEVEDEGSDSEPETISTMELDPEAIDDETEITIDPFSRHFRDDLDDYLFLSVSNTPQVVQTYSKKWPVLGNINITIPTAENSQKKTTNSNKRVTILEEKKYALPGTVPTIIKEIDYKALAIKSQIHDHIVSANKMNLIKKDLEITEKLTPLQTELFSVIKNYQDVCFPERTLINSEEIRFIYCLHAVNHILKTRTKILHHNAKLNKRAEVPDEFRDQGLVRPKVLMIVPFKDAAYRIVKTLIEILVPKEAGQVMNKNRFDEDFTGGELFMPKKNPKPEDYELLFSGNTDDTFRVGMALTKKTLKLYTDFYSSDIIIASPLGLRVIVGAEGEESRDYDFLSSIEVLILDQTDVFLMQNWDHLLHVMDHFHLQPKKTRGTDFSRIRSWAVNGWTKYYRQTLIFSSVTLPEINSLFNKRCFNYAGKVKASNPIDVGSIKHVAVQVPQVFHRIAATDPFSAVESRFDFFIKEVLPQYKDTLMNHTLIYIPSYFDYVSLRNYFKKEDISFVQICEYSKDAKIARARDMFFHTEAHFLLYSERVHFFRRFSVKGIRHIIFYQPPNVPHFYSEMCNLMQEANQNKYGGSEYNMTVTVLYTKYDLQQISAIVGTERTAKMAQSERNVHMFMTGE